MHISFQIMVNFTIKLFYIFNFNLLTNFLGIWERGDKTNHGKFYKAYY